MRKILIYSPVFCNGLFASSRKADMMLTMPSELIGGYDGRLKP